MSVSGGSVVDISTTLASLDLKNPFMLASGIMDEDAGSIIRIMNAGAGAVVTKSIGLHPRPGYPNPTCIETECGFLNAMGLPNPGVKEYLEELSQLSSRKVPLICSIYGASVQEFAELAQQITSESVDAFELNLSCPHAKCYGLETGSDPSLVKSITSSVIKNTSLPVFVKLSPNVTNIVELALAAEHAGASGIVAINTVKAMAINIEVQQPILANSIGGYSGKAVKPIGVRCVYEITQKVSIPVIGVGGITTVQDAIEYFMAGATAVQVGSALYSQGLEVFSQLTEALQSWMKDHGVLNIAEIIGVAHP